MAIRLGIEDAIELGTGVWEAPLSPSEVDALGRSRQRYGDRSVVAISGATYDEKAKLLSIDSGAATVLNRGTGDRTVFIEFTKPERDEDDDYEESGDARDRHRSRARSRSRQRQAGEFARTAARAKRAVRAAARAGAQARASGERWEGFGERLASEILGSLSDNFNVNLWVDDDENNSTYRASEKSGDGAMDVTLGSGDRNFIEKVGDLLSPDIRDAGHQFLVALRHRFDGDLVEGEARKFVESPNNFWSATIQPRDVSIAITAKGETTDYPWTSIDLRPDRPGHIRFKIMSDADLSDALSIVFASGGRFASAQLKGDTGAEPPEAPEPPETPEPPEPPKPSEPAGPAKD